MAAKTGPAATPLLAALKAWREVLGPERVLAGGDDRLERAQSATFATTQRSVALLEPGNRDEVAACLGIAQRYQVPVYPISTGCNWGYGSRVSPQDGVVLLSLARLNRIVDYSEDLAYVTVEPGVTFRMLAEFLLRQGSGLMPPLTGTTPDASLIGNVLERGIGKGPYEDMAAHSCGYEVILPTGQILRTGLAGFPNAVAAPLRAHGPGPSLQGLFNQSNLGVVTRMTLWLEPVPRWRQRVFFSVPDPAQLPAVINGLRGLLLRSGTSLQAELINDYRVLAMNQPFPFAVCDGAAALPRHWVADALGPWGGARWFGCATLWADGAEELEWRRRRLSAALAGTTGRWVDEEPGPGYDPASDLQDGLRSVYWRKRRPVPADPDPDRDGCGVIWLAPVLPLLGPEAAAALEEIEAAVLQAGFEPFVSLRMVGGRSGQAVVGLIYDREQPEADARALRCHQTLRGLLQCRGLFPYRLGLLDMDQPPVAADGSEALLRALGHLLDPHGILAPGRYLPSSPAEEAP